MCICEPPRPTRGAPIRRWVRLLRELLYSTPGGAGEVPHTLRSLDRRHQPWVLSSSSLVLAQFFEARPSFYPSFGRLHLRRRRAPPNPKTPPPTLSTRACSATSAAGRGVGGFVVPPDLTSAGNVMSSPSPARAACGRLLPWSSSSSGYSSSFPNATNGPAQTLIGVCGVSSMSTCSVYRDCPFYGVTPQH
jgi:hypothetical protein